MCTQVRIHDNKDQLVASSRWVPHCHFPDRSKNIYETEPRLCLCDSSLGCQSVKQPLAALRTIIFKLVWVSHVRAHTHTHTHAHSRFNILLKLSLMQKKSTCTSAKWLSLISSEWTRKKLQWDMFHKVFFFCEERWLVNWRPNDESLICVIIMVMMIVYHSERHLRFNIRRSYLCGCDWET